MKKKLLILFTIIVLSGFIYAFIMPKGSNENRTLFPPDNIEISLEDFDFVTLHLQTIKEQMNYFDTLFLNDMLNASVSTSDYIRQYVDTWKALEYNNNELEMLVNSLYDHVHLAMRAKQKLVDVKQDVADIIIYYDQLVMSYVYIDGIIKYIDNIANLDLSDYLLVNRDVLNMVVNSNSCGQLRVNSDSIYKDSIHSDYIAWYIGISSILSEYNELYIFAALDIHQLTDDKLKALMLQMTELEKLSNKCSPPLELASVLRSEIKNLSSFYEYKEKLNKLVADDTKPYVLDEKIFGEKFKTYSNCMENILDDRAYKEVLYHAIMELYTSRVFKPMIYFDESNAIN